MGGGKTHSVNTTTEESDRLRRRVRHACIRLAAERSRQPSSRFRRVRRRTSPSSDFPSGETVGCAVLTTDPNTIDPRTAQSVEPPDAVETGGSWIKRVVYPPPSIPREDILDLAHSAADAATAIKDIFMWRRERALKFAEGAFKASALVLTPLLAAVLAKDAHLTTWAVILYSASAVAFLILGLVWMARTTQIERSYGEETVVVADIEEANEPEPI